MITTEYVEALPNFVHLPAYGDLASRFPACVIDVKVPAENLSRKLGQVTCETCRSIAGQG